MTVKSFDFESIESYEYKGFVLVPSFTPSGKIVSAICEEIDFSMYGLNTSPWIRYSSVIKLFKNKVDKLLENKQFSYEDAEKELNRLKTLLKEQPAVFYGTRQVYDLLTLAEDLLAVSVQPKQQKEDPNLLEYHKQLDWLADWSNRLKPDALMIRRKLIEIHILFDKILDLSFEDVKREYFQRANKGENNDSTES